MVYIDDAGTGCILGVPVVVGLKDGNMKFVPMKDLKGARACAEVFALLTSLGVEKDEEIRICRGNVFDGFCHEAAKRGYTNIVRMSMKGEIQDFAEDVFMDSLYDLGLSKEVKLNAKDYEKCYEEIKAEIMKNPALMQYVRPHYLMNKGFTRIVGVVTRLQNEFPHLYEELKAL